MTLIRVTFVFQNRLICSNIIHRATFVSSHIKSFTTTVLTLFILALSFWAGINGSVFDQSNLDICTANNYALESLCWYAPEFSVLWRPFVVFQQPNFNGIIIMCYGVLVFVYLALPILRQLLENVIMTYLNLMASSLCRFQSRPQ